MLNMAKIKADAKRYLVRFRKVEKKVAEQDARIAALEAAVFRKDLDPEVAEPLDHGIPEKEFKGLDQ